MNTKWLLIVSSIIVLILSACTSPTGSNFDKTVINLSDGSILTVVKTNDEIVDIITTENNKSMSIFEKSKTIDNYYLDETCSIMGDANSSGFVDWDDILTQKDYILGRTVITFSFSCADVVEDSTINVLDIIATLHILYGDRNNSSL